MKIFFNFWKFWFHFICHEGFFLILCVSSPWTCFDLLTLLEFVWLKKFGVLVIHIFALPAMRELFAFKAKFKHFKKKHLCKGFPRANKCYEFIVFFLLWCSLSIFKVTFISSSFLDLEVITTLSPILACWFLTRIKKNHYLLIRLKSLPLRNEMNYDSLATLYILFILKTLNVIENITTWSDHCLFP